MSQFANLPKTDEIREFNINQLDRISILSYSRVEFLIFRTIGTVFLFNGNFLLFNTHTKVNIH